jgi:hypothetical protein
MDDQLAAPRRQPPERGFRPRLSSLFRGHALISILGAAALLGALAAGATLRLWNLGAQVMSGDEFHAIFAAFDRPVSQLLFFYQEADNCIPLSIVDRLVMDRGIALTEWIVRLPVLIAGFALLLLAPVWAWRRMGMGFAVVFAWLVALSPGLVFYSRIARSYAPATLFGCAAVAAFATWHRRGGLAAAAAYVACAVMAVWFHLGAAPLALSPFLVAALGLGATRVRGLARLALLGAATMAALAALLVPAQRTLLPILGGKHRELQVPARELAEVGAWLAGVGNRWVAAAVALIFVAGLAVLWRRDRWLGAFALGAVVAQVAAVLVLAPVAHQVTIVLARYLVFTLPCALVPIAAALGCPWPPRWRLAQPWLAALALAGLVACGPFLDPDLARSSFAHDELYVRFTEPRPRLEPGAGLTVYEWLAQAAPGALVELPWDPIFMADRVLGMYQTVHRRKVVVSDFRPDARLAFRNMTSDSPEEILAARGRWLIVHPAIIREQGRIGGGPWAPTPQLRRPFRRRALRAAEKYRALWGPPDYHSEWDSVWDLDRVRSHPPLPGPVRARFVLGE